MGCRGDAARFHRRWHGDLREGEAENRHRLQVSLRDVWDMMPRLRNHRQQNSWKGGAEKVFGEMSRPPWSGWVICPQGSVMFRNGTIYGGDMVAAPIGAFMARVVPTWARRN